MSPANTPFIIADYRYFVPSSISLDSQPSKRLHLVHHHCVLYIPRRQSSSQAPASTETQTKMQTYGDTASRPAPDNTMFAEEGNDRAELPSNTLKTQRRRTREDRWEPYPSATARTVARQTKKHTSTQVVKSSFPVLQMKEMDVEVEVARNYERRAQRMRASVKLYPDDDEDARAEGKEETYGRENSDNSMQDDHPYDPAYAAATANYFRCIQWLRNVPLYAPPDA